MGWMVSGTVDGFLKNLLDEFPKIRVCKSVDTHPKVLKSLHIQEITREVLLSKNL